MQKLSKIILVIGIILLAGSIIIFAAFQLNAVRSRDTASELIQQIEKIIPQRSNGIADTYTVMDMPVLQVDGQDFIGIIDVPAVGVKLPVYSTWDAKRIASFPCRFSGTAYDGSLVIGGADQEGQFDFLDRIHEGTVIIVTDMNGAEFSYTVSRIDRSKSAEANILIETEADLTLYVRDAYALDYIIVRCTA